MTEGRTDEPGDTLAAGVVLLPPAEVAARAQAINRQLREANPEGLILDADHLPHITLVQQFVRRDRLPEVVARIEEALGDRAPLELRISGSVRRGATAWLAIEPVPGLQALHDALMEALASIADAPGDPEAFHPGDPPARPGDLEWVREYRTRSAYARYAPHITVGHGDPPVTEPAGFNFRRIALCHLGRYCTCRAILREWRLPLSPAPPRPARG